jgi:hypothetical protein
MPLDPDDGELDDLVCDALLELYRLRCHMRVREFKEELRRDAATVRRALDEVFWKIEQREGRQS